MSRIPPDPKYLLRSDMGSIHSLLFWINSNVEHLYAGCNAGKVYIWDLKKNRILEKLTVGSDPCLNLRTTNTEYLLTQQKCGVINIYKITNTQWTFDKMIDCEYNSFCRCDLLSQDTVVVALKDANIGILSLKTSKIELILESIKVPCPKQLGELMIIKVLPNFNDIVLAAYEGGLLVLWDIKTNKVLHWLEIEPYPMALDFHTLSMKGIIGNPTNNLQVFSLSSNTILSTKRTVAVKNPGTSVIAIRPDAKVFSVGNWDGRIRIFSWKSLNQLATLSHHRDTIHDVIYSSCEVDAYDSKYLMAAAGKDSYISLWDIYN